MMNRLSRQNLKTNAVYEVWAAAAVLLIAAIIAYHNSLQVPFHFDDVKYIRDNAYIQDLRYWWKIGLETARPVVYFSFALNYAAGGLATWGYHATNLAIHWGAALFLFGIIRRTLLNRRLASRSARSATILAAITALLWLVHPLQTESVTYIYQRAESLMGFWYLLMLYCVIRGDADAGNTRWYTIAVAACALGMATKAIMATAPVVVALYDRTFLAGSWRASWRKRRSLYAAFGGTWLLLIWLLIAGSAEYDRSAGLSFSGVTWLQYVRSQPGVILHYLSLAFWPVGQVFDYGWPVARTFAGVVPPVIIVGGLLAVSVWAICRGLEVGVLGAWFFLILAPTSLVRIQDLAVEHRMYLSLAAVSLFAVLTGEALLSRAIRSVRVRLAVGSAIVVIVVSALTVLTIKRNHIYVSQESLWADVMDKRPGNARAYYSMGIFLGDERSAAASLPYFREACRLNPEFVMGHYNLAVALSRERRYTEAFHRYQELIMLHPSSDLFHYAFGLSLANAGLYPEAAVKFLDALAINPKYIDAHYDLAVTLCLLGRRQEAIEHFIPVLLNGSTKNRPQEKVVSAIGQLGILDATIKQLRLRCQEAGECP